MTDGAVEMSAFPIHALAPGFELPEGIDVGPQHDTPSDVTPRLRQLNQFIGGVLNVGAHTVRRAAHLPREALHAGASTVRKVAQFPREVFMFVLKAPEVIIAEATRRTERFRARGLIVLASGVVAIALLVAGLVVPVGTLRTKSADDAMVVVVTLFETCVTRHCHTPSPTCTPGTSCSSESQLGCQSEQLRYSLALVFYVTGIVINVIAAILGAFDALRRLPDTPCGGCISLRVIFILITGSAALASLLAFVFALGTWLSVQCGPAYSGLAGAQPGRSPFLALLTVMANAGATTNAWVTRTRYELTVEEIGRSDGARVVPTMVRVTIDPVTGLPMAIQPRAKTRRRWLYDDPDEASLPTQRS